MDENRWPRAGPGLVAVFALLGLIGGILAGLFNPSGAQRSSDRTSETASTAPPAVSELPDQFYTVIVASIGVSRGRPAAEARASELRAAGVEDVGVLDPSRYHSLDAHYWAVYSGVFSTWQQAVDHCDQIHAAHPDLPRCYAKQVRDHT
jgi:hypothetical protein